MEVRSEIMERSTVVIQKTVMNTFIIYFTYIFTPPILYIKMPSALI